MSPVKNYRRGPVARILRLCGFVPSIPSTQRIFFFRLAFVVTAAALAVVDQTSPAHVDH